MLMSADSSDSHACSSNALQAGEPASTAAAASGSNQALPLNSTAQPTAATSAKTSVICMPAQANGGPAASTTTSVSATPPTTASVVQAAPASSTTPNTALVIGRSHLENALKLPPNTSVSTYYQNTKLLTGVPTAPSASSNNAAAAAAANDAHATQQCVVFQAPAPASANSIYERASTSLHPHHHQHLQHNAQQQQQQQRLHSYMHAPVTDMDTVSSGVVANAAAAAANAASTTTARKMPHSNVIYVNNKSNANGGNASIYMHHHNATANSISNGPPGYATNATNAGNGTPTPPPPPPPPPLTQQQQQQLPTAQHSVVSTSDYTDYGVYHQHQHQHQQQHHHQQHPHHGQQHIVARSHQLAPHMAHNGNNNNNQQQQQYNASAGVVQHQQQHGNNVVSTYQQHNGGVGTVVVVAADSRPQTPDYIKSYPVMDTTVASSVKGEPELNIEFDGTTVLCRVCGDKASGFHYGVHSCEGCKGFFRRSIQQKIQYRPCTKNQQCSILRINRNRCQYCRLKKCIAVGMSRDAVRFGRVPKREKARILAAMQQSTQNRGQQRALATELDDQPRLLAAVLRAHLDTCEFTKEKVAAMRQRARECPSYSMPTLLACPLNPAPELQSEQEFSQRFAHVIRGVIDFAGMIPGFQLLTQDDKFTLLKAGLFDALFVRLICMFDSSINSIICLNGQVMRRDAIQNGANARFLVDSTFNFAERMNSMNLSDAEIGLFCAIVLITPDRPGLRNIELIEKMYSRLKGCLQSIINQNRPDQPEFMSKLLETMPDLRTLSTLHTEKLVVFRTEHKELLRQQMWTMDDDQSPNSKSPGVWDDGRMDVEAKSPLGSVSSTESGDLDYTTSSTSAHSSTAGHPHLQHAHHPHAHHPHQPSALASSAPLLAATLSGTCPIRNRANSGSSGDSGTDLDIVGSHAHLTQNGLTITPIVRAHSHQQLHHHLTAGAPHRYRKLDSPTDSGIESGNEKNECGSKAVSSGGSSSCSSPRSSVDDALDCSDAAAAAANAAAAAAAAASTSQVTVSVSPVRSPQLGAPSSTSSLSASTSSGSPPCTLKRQIVDDMPVLKRVLQAPPLYDTNSLMDEAYKPHKKFRALRHREYETAEADASSTSNGNSATPTTTATLPASSPHGATQSPPPQSVVVPHISPLTVNAAATSPHPAPPVQPAAHQSQLHMHLTRPSPTSQQHQQHQQQHQHQQHSASSLSSTHSVLAKSLMAEPRMTPEQMKRSDIIQNYIMRDNTAASSSSGSQNGHLVCTPTGPGSRSPAPMHMQHTHHGYGSPAASSSSSSSSNSNCASPSTTTVTLASPPPPALLPPHANNARWPGHTVITTTCVNQRQQSVSPNSNGSTSSSTSSASSSGCQYFQSPHSTSVSVSPPRRSPAAMHTPPRLLELQVDIADSQQPLNLSKKSPTPPPSKLQALVAAASAVQRYPTVSADVTVTATTAPPTPATTPNGQNGAQQMPPVHKVMLEA